MMKVKYLNLLIGLIYIPFILHLEAGQNVKDDYCIKNSLIEGLLTRIKVFSLAEPYEINCSQYEKISLIPENTLFISTKRIRGKDQICLTDSKDSGNCTYKIGYFVGSGNPSYKLCKMMKADCSSSNKPALFTETVERLYLKPSSLIR